MLERILRPALIRPISIPSVTLVVPRAFVAAVSAPPPASAAPPSQSAPTASGSPAAAIPSSLATIASSSSTAASPNPPATTTSSPPTATASSSLAAATSILPTAEHESLRLLPLIRSQPLHYTRIHIHGFPFLVTVGDIVTLPFLLKEVSLGDVLRLDKASILGSRDYTIKGNPYIDEKYFTCRATVMGETSEPMRIKEKTKRRQRRVKKVKSKHRYTVLRIRELEVNDPSEIA